MKLVMENIGLVSSLEMPIRPLTVLIGPNQSGKTTIANALYAAAGSDAPIRVPDAVPETMSRLELRDLVLAAVEPREAKAFARFFQDRSGVYGAGKARLIYEPAELLEALGAQLGAVDPEGGSQPVVPPRVYERGRAPKLWNSDRFGEFAMNLRRHLAPRVPFALPAERGGLLLTYKMLANRRFRLMRDRNRALFVAEDDEAAETLSRGLGEPRFAEPIEAFLDFLANAEQLHIARRTRKPGPRSTRLSTIAKTLERAMLGEQSLEWSPVGLGGAELRLRLDADRSIDLHLASGALKNIAPLLLWLRGFRGDLLVVDEPELGLHPIAQAKVLEALAMVAKAGVRVFVTTHSAAVMVHLNNLMAPTSTDSTLRAQQATRLYLKDEAAFLTPSDVGAFEVTNGTVRDLYDPEFGVRWDTLSEGIEELNQIYFDLLAAGEERGARA